MNSSNSNSKTLGVIAYLTFIGLIIASIMNLEKRDKFIYFHIRQMLGLILMLIVSNVIEAYVDSYLGTGLWIVTFCSWLFGLIGAISGKKNEIPYIGHYFQSWFQNIK